MSKRSADDGTAAIGGQPPIKKVQFEPHLIGPVSTLEELDIKVLQFQNKKLAQVRHSTKKNPNISNITQNLHIYSPIFLQFQSVLNNEFDARLNYGSELSN